jgi:CRISPR-associated protein Cmr6
VPVVFLVVTGAFVIDLAGPDCDEVDRAAGWLRDAADDVGVGAKTAAGYGYLRVEAS